MITQSLSLVCCLESGGSDCTDATTSTKCNDALTLPHQGQRRPRQNVTKVDELMLPIYLTQPISIAKKKGQLKGRHCFLTIGKGTKGKKKEPEGYKLMRKTMQYLIMQYLVPGVSSELNNPTVYGLCREYIGQRIFPDCGLNDTEIRDMMRRYFCPRKSKNPSAYRYSVKKTISSPKLHHKGAARYKALKKVKKKTQTASASRPAGKPPTPTKKRPRPADSVSKGSEVPVAKQSKSASKKTARKKIATVISSDESGSEYVPSSPSPRPEPTVVLTDDDLSSDDQPIVAPTAIKNSIDVGSFYWIAGDTWWMGQLLSFNQKTKSATVWWLEAEDPTNLNGAWVKQVSTSRKTPLKSSVPLYTLVRKVDFGVSVDSKATTVSGHDYSSLPPTTTNDNDADDDADEPAAVDDADEPAAAEVKWKEYFYNCLMDLATPTAKRKKAVWSKLSDEANLLEAKLWSEHRFTSKTEASIVAAQAKLILHESSYYIQLNQTGTLVPPKSSNTRTVRHAPLKSTSSSSSTPPVEVPVIKPFDVRKGKASAVTSISINPDPSTRDQAIVEKTTSRVAVPRSPRTPNSKIQHSASPATSQLRRSPRTPKSNVQHSASPATSPVSCHSASPATTPVSC